MTNDADVVIIGGGIMGCASAYELCTRGLEVILYEMADVGSGQSGRNWGFVRQQGRDLRELPLMEVAIRLWPPLADELQADTEWTQSGGLAIARDAKTRGKYEAWIRRAAAFGIDTRLVGDAEIHSLVPGIGGRWETGMYTPTDGHADPVKTTAAFADAAQSRGARFTQSERVDSIATHHGRVRGVVTGRGLTRAPIVICAAGRWSRDLLRPVGVDIPLANVRETVTLSMPASTPLLPLPIWTSDLAARQRADRRIVISNGGVGEIDVSLAMIRQLPQYLPGYLEHRAMFRLNIRQPILRGARSYFGLSRKDVAAKYETPYDAFVTQSLKSLHETLPATIGLEPERSWAGTIDATPDGLPIVERLGRPLGLIIATGFSGHGFGMAPAIAKILAQLAVDEKTSVNTEALSASRFGFFRTSKPSSVL